MLDTSTKEYPKSGATPGPRSGRKFAKAEDIVAVHKLLSEVLEPMGNGKVKYTGGFSDQRVVEKLGIPHIVEDTVARLRRRLFGGLGEYARSSALRARFEGRLQAIEARLEALEKLWQ